MAEIVSLLTQLHIIGQGDLLLRLDTRIILLLKCELVDHAAQTMTLVEHADPIRIW